MAAQLSRRATSTPVAVMPLNSSIVARDSYGSCNQNVVAIIKSDKRTVPLTTPTVSSRSRRKRWMVYWPVSR